MILFGKIPTEMEVNSVSAEIHSPPAIAVSTTKMQTQASPSLRCSKRKRAAVSYVEPDLDDDMLLDSEQEEQEDDEDDDGEFGKRQKVS